MGPALNAARRAFLPFAITAAITAAIGISFVPSLFASRGAPAGIATIERVEDTTSKRGRPEARLVYSYDGGEGACVVYAYQAKGVKAGDRQPYWMRHGSPFIETCHRADLTSSTVMVIVMGAATALLLVIGVAAAKRERSSAAARRG